MAGVNKERKNGGCKQVNCLKSRFSFVDLGLKFLKEDTSLKLVLYLLNVLRSMVVSISENSFVVVSFFRKHILFRLGLQICTLSYNVL